MESSRKAHYIGMWQEDTFSDEVLKNIAAHAQAEKGKRVKLTMNKEGLRIKKQRIFKDNVIDFHPFKSLKAVTKNTRYELCVMFIMSDSVKKYQIIAVRCDSDADSIYITNYFKQFKQNNTINSMELRKRGDTGNWTLRDRSAHNANQHLKEVFNEQSNGDVNGNHVTSTSKEVTVPNGILKRSISTENSPFPYSTGQDEVVTTVISKNDGDDDYRAVLRHTEVAERLVNAPEGRPTSLKRSTVLLPNKPRIVQNGRIDNAPPSQTINYRRTSRDFTLYKQYQPVRRVPGRSSMILTKDSKMVVAQPQRTTSLRLAPTSHTFSTSSTIQRSIEETYAKPVIVQTRDHRSRRASGGSVILSRNQRPYSVHVMGDNSLQMAPGSNSVATKF